jgi:chorismate mutase
MVELDLQLSDLRIKLDQMTERIVSRLKDRSRFKLNKPVYLVDAITIAGRTGISFLEFALEGLEQYHAKLGRYNYPDQHPLVSSQLPPTPVTRERATSPISRIQIDLRADIISFYVKLLHELCQEAEDAATFGETAYVDADLIELLNERINLGRYVAESKLHTDPVIAEIRDTELLTKRLREYTREKQVLQKAREIARRYDLDPKVAEKLFSWIIQETVKVELAYLRKRQ